MTAFYRITCKNYNMKGGFLLFSTDQYDFVNATPEIFLNTKLKDPTVNTLIGLIRTTV